MSRSFEVAGERPFYSVHADVYDALVDAPVGPWVDVVHARLRATGHDPATIVDAGCGTGRHARALMDLGHTVELVDASWDLLQVAGRRCRGAITHHADLTTFAPGARFDAVVSRGVLNDMASISAGPGCPLTAGVADVALGAPRPGTTTPIGDTGVCAERCIGRAQAFGEVYEDSPRSG